MVEDITSEQQADINKMPEPLQEFVYRIMKLEAPYCYAVLDAIEKYNHDLDVPESVVNSMGTEGMQIWVDFLTAMEFAKAETKNKGVEINDMHRRRDKS